MESRKKYRDKEMQTYRTGTIDPYLLNDYGDLSS